jgi:hypothetical protein
MRMISSTAFQKSRSSLRMWEMYRPPMLAATPASTTTSLGSE